jgi:hypothetical protein
MDCGHSTNGAFALFFRWLDQYAASIGNPDMFRVSQERW